MSAEIIKAEVKEILKTWDYAVLICYRKSFKVKGAQDRDSAFGKIRQRGPVPIFIRVYAKTYGRPIYTWDNPQAFPPSWQDHRKEARNDA